MAAHCLALVFTAVLTAGPDTVVVSPPGYLDALRPWLAHRSAQGHRITFVSNAGTAEQIRGEIRQAARTGELRFVLLVGDAEQLADADPRVRARCVPTHLATAKVNVRWHSTRQYATDNWYADLDDDQIPDLAVGRLPADSPQDLAVMVGKILRYEQARKPGPWCQRLNFIAGMGGFGPLLDPVLEMATRKFLTDGIPPEYDTSMTYGNWRSPFCPSPYAFHDVTISRLNEGCLFWVYIGHGYPYRLDRVEAGGRSYHILGTSDMLKLDNDRGAPIALFLACYTGAFDQPYDCLGEQMLRAAGGPVAVLAGTRVMMPYGMAVFSSGLMDEYFHKRPATLGEVILHAKQRMMDENHRGMSRRLLDLLATALSPDSHALADERREHVGLFNLLGDPLLRLYYPESVALDVAPKATAGSYLEIRGTSPVPGRCTVELVCRRDHLRMPRPARRRFDTSRQTQFALNRTYAAANDSRWSSRQVEVERGPFLTALKVPQQARGVCYVRAFVEQEGTSTYALGAATVDISSPTTDSLPAEARLKDEPAAETAGVQATVSDTTR